ncbi:RNase H family protein [Blattabacterium cuenoti]|uniref:RNase H family protein n=1 Tax=Blattabacterium cuenoti TaxID=1653831 RepID=UPI00293BD417|nr:RNase H family protein [Blattabacterium cuenoti]
MKNHWIDKWKKNNFYKKKNIDLWKRFIKIFNRNLVTFHWIKSHNNHYINDYCDQISLQSSKKKNLKIDDVYEKHLLKIGLNHQR